MKNREEQNQQFQLKIGQLQDELSQKEKMSQKQDIDIINAQEEYRRAIDEVIYE